MTSQSTIAFLRAHVEYVHFLQERIVDVPKGIEASLVLETVF